MKTAKIVIGLVVIGFLAGIFGGYTIWRPKDDQKADLRELVAKVGDAAERIEKRNQDLASQVEALKGNAREAEAMKAENQALKGQLDNSVQEMNRMTASMSGLNARVSEAEKVADERKQLKAENADLQGRITGLDNQVRTLKDQLKQKQQVIAEKVTAHDRLQTELSAARQEAQQGEKLKALIDELQGRISALEKENLDLRAVIDNISEMTKRKEAP
jgi:chromosome segregation ATPase